ncbi:NPCBM/NEW2 domain-containing protein, partial [Streptomyces sp. NPDC000594]|uniref:NPCBM/NEW2 domain-containing protein n=1 Tax=Streptomyces sp. NPDC000594 TaxID=3154261 RepID=UPI00332A9B4F
AKAGVAAVLAVAAAVGLAWAFAGDSAEPAEPSAKPPAAQPVVPPEPAPPKPSPPKPPPPPPKPAPRPPAPPAAERPVPPKPAPAKPSPSASPRPAPSPKPPPPKPAPTPPPSPSVSPSPPPAPTVYRLSRLRYSHLGDGSGPEVRTGESGWLWQRYGLSVGGKRYAHGATVHASSSVTIDLNRRCSSYDAVVGIDDLMAGWGAARFAVYGDGQRLWRSPVVRAGDPAVPLHVPLTGRTSIRLVVTPHTALDSAVLADWADSAISCA